ncbi:VPLPA-CTERM sorting domain-containing protein [Paenirhodobacter sp.]|uniref:VPLPA-CTERM sorting domain-containing protein n=1 Tax=Paenirhodobacter sp. TaxID=1965326 RepID=UPI003B3C7AB3
MLKPILAALALGMVAVPATAATQNLIVNGTFDDFTTGWIGNYQIRDSDPKIDTGSYFFPGPGAFHMIYQNYALTHNDLTRLHDTGLKYTLSADLFGWHSQRDRGTLSVFFLNDKGKRITSDTLMSSTLYDGWWDTEIIAGGKYFQSTSGLVPAETMTLQFVISSTRIGGGTNNDGYIDNAAFTMADVPAVPLPAGLPLIASGLLALGLIRRR